MSILISGTEECIAMLNRFSDADALLADGIAKAGEAVAETARGLCPVDTGNLQASICSSASGTHADIGTECEYAAYVEFGTYKMAAQPYMVPAITAAQGAITEAVLSALEG